MSNMGHCRFQNTLADLIDCAGHLDDETLSKDEERARMALVAMCERIADDYGKKE